MATREHIQRKADGGLDDPNNIAMACAECNSLRGDTPPHEWMEIREAQMREAAEAMTRAREAAPAREICAVFGSHDARTFEFRARPRNRYFSRRGRK